MRTTDGGTGPDEPRYGRRRPDGEQPADAGRQPWAGQNPDPTRPGADGGSAGAPGSYGQQPQHGQQQGGYGAPSPFPQPGGSTQPGGWQAGPQGSGGYTPGAYGPAGYGQQYGGYGQPGYGAPTGPPPKRTGPIIALVVGALLMLGAPIIGFVIAIATATDSFSEMATDGAQISNGGSVDLPSGVERMVIFEASNVAAGTTCDVVDPGGRSLPVSTTIDAFGSDDVPLPGVTFQTTAAGSYTITCDLPSGVSQSLIVTPPLDFGSLLSGGVSILIGLAFGFLGLVVLIIGIIWLVRVNKRIRTGQY